MVGTAQRAVPNQRAMHNQIGVTPDGTREMQIIRLGQAIVAERLRIVSGAVEAFEQSYFERLLLGLSTDHGEQSLQLAAMSQIANPVIKAQHEFAILRQFLGIWIFMDA